MVQKMAWPFKIKKILDAGQTLIKYQLFSVVPYTYIGSVGCVMFSLKKVQLKNQYEMLYQLARFFSSLHTYLPLAPFQNSHCMVPHIICDSI